MSPLHGRSGVSSSWSVASCESVASFLSLFRISNCIRNRKSNRGAAHVAVLRAVSGDGAGYGARLLRGVPLRARLFPICAQLPAEEMQAVKGKGR